MSPTSSPLRALRGAALACAFAVVAAGCSLGGSEEPSTSDGERPSPIASSTPDPSRDALLVEVERLETSVDAARDVLAEALASETLAGVRTAADDARGLLVAESNDRSTDHPPPLFPARSADRDEDHDTHDQLTATLTAARDAGGRLGHRVVDLLRDPVAGDLGAWQRDAAGVLASVEATTAEASDLAGLEAAIGELPGLGTQALAWIALAGGATDLDTAHAYVERAVASLDVVTVSVELLLEDDAGGADAEDDADGADAPGGDDPAGQDAGP